MSTETTAPNNASTTTPISKPADNVNSSEYQSSYSWKLPMVQVNRPKERTVTEYQREFTWKEPPTVSTPSPTPAVVNPPETLPTSRSTPQPTVVERLAETTKTDIPTTIKTPELKRRDLPPTPTPPPITDMGLLRHNGDFVGEPEESYNAEKSFSNSDVLKWKDGLRKDNGTEQKQSTLASSLDPRAKKIVALEASRLSKKSRSYSMYSLADQLKTMEIARDLSNPMESEYKQQFINWQDYSRVESEGHPENGQSLRRRGSWSSSLPAPLKWLESLDLDDPLSRESRRLKPTITDANSIRANPKRPTTSADFRDYGSLDADYGSSTTIKSNKQSDQDYYTVDAPRPLHRAKSSVDLSRSKSLGGSPLRHSVVSNNLDERDLANNLPEPVDARRRDFEKESRNRSTYIDDRRHGYEHLYDKNRRGESVYDEMKRDGVYDERRRDAYDEKRRDGVYDEKRRDGVYDEKRRDGVYDEKRRDGVYDEKRRDNAYDDKRRDNGMRDERGRDSVYDNKRRDGVYDERRRDNFYDERTRDGVYEEKRRGHLYDEKKRDHVYDEYYDSNGSGRMDYDRRRDDRQDNRYNNDRHKDYNGYNEIRQRDNGFDERNYASRQSGGRRDHEDYESRYNNGRSLKTSDHEQYGHYVDLPAGGGHTRNPSYASSSKSSIYDDVQPPTAHPSYLEHLRHRSSFSDVSSISTPSSPATPNGLYDIVEQKWRTNNGLDPRIYKEQSYASSVVSKASSNSPRSSWPVDDAKDRYYQPSVLSPSRNKFYVDDDEEDEYSSQSDLHGKRQSHSRLNSVMLRDRGLKSSTSTPRSHNSMHSSPSYTRDPSPSHDSYSRKPRQHMIVSPTLSPSYSSRPESRASVSSHATSIEEESALLTDILKDAEGLTIKNLNTQLAMFKSRDFTSIAPGVEKKSHSTPATRKTSVASGSTTSKAVSSKSISSKTTSKNNSAPGTPGAGPKSKGLNSKGTPGSRPINSMNTTSSYREAYRDYTQERRPTDFSAAREALNRAKLKVDEMLELVSNGGIPY
ncbi:14722_t:CDS:2 [Acaulospora morrowiae]|uniref:14722_t:CDS:1 n=1 Tax=Acaulospora morrowiae TaxID=94023 RepID=A0A9N8YK79_9GLOM|nr:14722_t:CDS:2 [Acaulospora morrowiae]